MNPALQSFGPPSGPPRASVITTYAGKLEATVPKRARKGRPLDKLEFRLRKDKFRQICRREGRYRLRTNLRGDTPERLGEMYLQLTQVEEAFRNLKGDLSIRPSRLDTITAITPHVSTSTTKSTTANTRRDIPG